MTSQGRGDVTDDVTTPAVTSRVGMTSLMTSLMTSQEPGRGLGVGEGKFLVFLVGVSRLHFKLRTGASLYEPTLFWQLEGWTSLVLSLVHVLC